jgi:hypothetical protein
MSPQRRKELIGMLRALYFDVLITHDYFLEEFKKTQISEEYRQLVKSLRLVKAEEDEEEFWALANYVFECLPTTCRNPEEWELQLF